jgi:membrane protease YdiL (CAAX protease family)
MNRFRSTPLTASLVVFGLYLAWFLVPVLFVDLDPNRHGLSGVVGAIGQWKNQILLTIILTAVVSMLGWWGKIGFSTLNRGGLKFLILPVAYILLLLGSVIITNHNASWLLAASNPQQLLALVLVMLGIGFTEETMFRGILFYGFSTRFSMLAAVIFSSLLFGTLHYINMLQGAALTDTTNQVLHAAAAGFMYIALRLRIGAIWPVMLFHSLWDFCLFNIDSLNTAAGPTYNLSPLATAAMEILPATLYGAFVYWRWTVHRKKTEAPLAERKASESPAGAG